MSETTKKYMGILSIIIILGVVGSIIYNFGHTNGYNDGYNDFDKIKNLYDDFEQINQNNLDTCIETLDGYKIIIDTWKITSETCTNKLNECTNELEFWYNSSIECSLLTSKCVDTLKEALK